MRNKISSPEKKQNELLALLKDAIIHFKKAYGKSNNTSKSKT